MDEITAVGTAVVDGPPRSQETARHPGAYCFQHKGRVAAADGPAVLVGAIERGSGPARPVYACTPCVLRHDILPLAEHPDDSDGHPLHCDGRPFAPGRPS